MPYYLKFDTEVADLTCLEALPGFRARPHYSLIKSYKTSFAGIKHKIRVPAEPRCGAFQAVEQSSLPARQVAPKLSKEGHCFAHRILEGSFGVFGLELPQQWKSQTSILRKYSVMRFGYFAVGDDGILNRSQLRGARWLKSATVRLLRAITHAPVPGWYDSKRAIPALRRSAPASGGEGSASNDLSVSLSST